MHHGVSLAPVISVIVPIYRVRDYIVDCLQSLLDQVDSPPYELILVDDCGGDDSVDLALRFLSRAEVPFTYNLLYHASNRGASAARNTGLEAAKGQYVFFLDSDDCLLPHALQQLFHAAVDSQADVTIGSVELTSPTKEHTRYFRLPTFGVLDGNMFLDLVAADVIYSTPWNRLIRRTFLTENHLKFVEGIVCEDRLWGMELAFFRPTACLLKCSTYLYRNIREGSVMSRVTPLHLASRLYILARISTLPDQHQITPGRGFKDNIKDMLNSYLWGDLQMAYTRKIDLHPFSDMLSNFATPVIRQWYKQSQNGRLRRIGRILRLWPLWFRRWLLYLYLMRTLDKGGSSTRSSVP